MTDTLERCARAYCWARCQEINSADGLRKGCMGGEDCWRWEESAGGVRSIVEALLEPDEAMLEAMQQICPWDVRSMINDAEARAMWRAGLKAVLGGESD